jgi:hypothetical protein
MSVRIALSSGYGIENLWLKYLSDAPSSPSGPPYLKKI